MTSPILSLASEDYKKNLCAGLSAFQQCSEFVDMTIAADGHFVQVHKMMLAIASPYLKEIICSAPCLHPILFLNDITHSALCGILEYVYTGEVQVSSEHLTELLAAAKALHITGLDEAQITNEVIEVKIDGNDIPVKYIRKDTNRSISVHKSARQDNESSIEKENETSNQNTLDEASNDEYEMDVISSEEEEIISKTRKRRRKETARTETSQTKSGTNVSLQYTVSNQGKIQLIMNRYIYYRKYTKLNGEQKWRCTAERLSKCPASLIVKDDMVLKRTYAHNHPYHDRRILRKSQMGAIFSAMSEADEEIANMKERRENELNKK